ncbi:MAG TPA: type II secretion system protein N [Steroidobacteraceae bacterium]|nr:type II secretion system protein N [Steroidobacteraceae bacterium]
MRRPIWIALAAVAGFAVIVLTRLPASWIVPRAAAADCASVDGTVWSGACSGLSVQHVPLGDLSWDLEPARLLAGTLAAHIVLAHGALAAQAEVTLGLGGAFTVRNLRADLPLDPALLPQLPRNLHGRAHAALALVRIEHGALSEIQGRIEAHDLEERTVRATPLGNYAVSFPGGSGEPTGRVQDLGGPLAVQGTLRLTRERGYVLEGQVTARPGAPPELAANLAYLGSPDALGRRPFSLTGTL